MMASDRLSGVDRGTLVAWRTFNILGWTLVAVGGTVLATWLTNRLGPPQLFLALGTDPFAFRPALYMAIGTGIGVGLILGYRTYAYAAGLASAVAALHVIVSSLSHVGYGSSAGIVFIGPGFFLEKADKMLIGGIEIVLAFVVATLVSKRRPLALRGGRPAQ